MQNTLIYVVIPSEYILVITYVLPLYQLLFFTVQLFTFDKGNPSRLYMGLLLLTMTLLLLISVVHYLIPDGIPETVQLLFYPIMLAILPIFFQYMVSVWKEDSMANRFDSVWLFTPSMVLLLANFVCFLLNTPICRNLPHFALKTTGFSVYSTIHLYLTTFGLVFVILAQIILVAITIKKITWMTYTRKREGMKQHLIFHPAWIVVMLISLLVFIGAITIQHLHISGKPHAVNFATNVCLLVCSGIIGFIGIRQYQVSKTVTRLNHGGFQNNPSTPADNPFHGQITSHHGNIKKPNILVPDEEANDMINRLKELMQNEKPFLQASFSLQELSQSSGIGRQTLSYVINTVMGSNFCTFINEYRIKEAIRLMENQSGVYTLEAIAKQAGFKSKSTFYNSFKKVTGMNPGDYLSDKRP